MDGTGHFLEIIVGGVPYTTTQETLTKSPESIFQKLLEEGTANKHETCFLDRDGQLFRHVLNFLRTGKLCLPESFDEYAQLRLEAEFYGLPELIRELDMQINADVIHVEFQEHWLNWDCSNLVIGPLHKLKNISPFKEYFVTEGKEILAEFAEKTPGIETFCLGKGSTVRVDWAGKMSKAGWMFRNQSMAGLGNTEHWLYCTTDSWTFTDRGRHRSPLNGAC